MPDTVGRFSSLRERYVVERELGQGGMATVYLARDLKHDRRVALKVLRPELAAILGVERFLHEIRTTASLQHPHILPLHDSGETGGQVYYVMPYVEGESLRDRLTREKQLPVAEAVRIATEVAGALDYAHRHGVVHRDIKPENILLHEGQALVADFGIALAVSTAGGGTRLTETGISLGTPHYMSPEQAMGEKEITPKSDVYSLGCVLYEMLSGEPPFTGPTAQAVVARVLTEEPRALGISRRTVPPHVEAAVLTALAKLPADRFATAAEFAAALGERPGDARMAAPAPPGAWPRRSRGRWRGLIPWAVAALAVAAALWGWARRPARPAGVVRAFVTLSDSVALLVSQASTLAISPDGSRLAFVDDRGGGRLWVRRLSDLRPVALPGTEGARFPAFSPDGQWIAFTAGPRLEKVRVDGGATIALADSANSDYGGVAWLDADNLAYADLDYQIRRVAAAGGANTVVLPGSRLAGGAAGWIEPLPGGHSVLFTWCNSNCNLISVRALDLATGEQRVVVDGALHGWYLPGGRIFYVRRDGAGLVAPFDARRLTVTGPAVPVLQDVFTLGGSYADVALSATGTLVYAAGPEGSGQQRWMVRVSRAGRATIIDSALAGDFTSFALSADGRRLAITAQTGDQSDVWVKTLDRGPFTRLTLDGHDRRPAWSPDGREVAFIRDTVDGGAAFVTRADGTGPERVLARYGRPVQEVEWSPDGRWLLLRTDNAAAGHGDVVGVRAGGDTTPVPLLATPSFELTPAVSPDGRWIAYSSDESGEPEVFVRPFPNTGAGRWQVSIGGGSHPQWSRDGRQLYYLAPDPPDHLVAAWITAEPTFGVARRETLFATGRYDIDTFHRSFEVAPDGQSFVFAAFRDALADRPLSTQVVLVEHWFDEVDRLTGR